MATYAAGTIVFFYHQAELCLGILTVQEENRWQVLDLEGNVHLLSSDRFVLASRNSYLPPEQSALVTFSNLLADTLPSLNMEDIHAKLSLLENAFTFEAAAETVGCDSDASRFTLFQYLRLSEDRYLLKKGLWRVRTEEEIAKFELQKNFDAVRARYLEEVASWLKQLREVDFEAVPCEAVDNSLLGDDFRKQLATELRELLSSNEPKDLARILRIGGQKLEDTIHVLRLRLSDISPTTDPIAAASGIPISFRPGLAAQAVSPEPSGIEDCEPFTIDAADSPDLDDAISWQETAAGWRLGVHISDIAARIPLQSELWTAARDRVASLYLPSQTIPLLPGELSEDSFSLREGELRPALSLFVEFDREAGIKEYSFRQGWVRVRKNLSYESFDKLLREQERSPLLELCRKIYHARVGETEERKPRYTWNLKVTDGDVAMLRTDNCSPARFIIEELMILYNRLLAEHACQQRLPLIYRNISQFREDDDEESGNFGIQAYLSTEAKFHPGIGAQAYLHATSPIRRFTDIVNQAQFSALLAGREPACTRDQLEDLILSIEKRLQLLRAVTHRSERYWLLRWLEQKHLGEPLDTVLLRRLKQGYLAELTRWEKRIVLRCEAGLPLRVPVKLVVDSVDVEELLVFGDIIP